MDSWWRHSRSMIPHPAIPATLLHGGLAFPTGANSGGGGETEFTRTLITPRGGAYHIALQVRWDGYVYFHMGSTSLFSLWNTGPSELSDPATWDVQWERLNSWHDSTDTAPFYSTQREASPGVDGVTYHPWMHIVSSTEISDFDRLREPEYILGSTFASRVDTFMPAAAGETLYSNITQGEIAPRIAATGVAGYPRDINTSSEQIFVWCSDFGTQPLNLHPGQLWECVLDLRIQKIRKVFGGDTFQEFFPQTWRYTIRLDQRASSQ